MPEPVLGPIQEPVLWAGTCAVGRSPCWSLCQGVLPPLTEALQGARGEGGVLFLPENNKLLHAP